MPSLDVTVLESVDKALNEVSRELTRLRDAGRSIGSASGTLQDASASILLTGESVIALAESVKEVTSAISKLDPSALATRLSAIQSTLSIAHTDLTKVTVDGRDQLLDRIASLETALMMFREQLGAHATETKAWSTTCSTQMQEEAELTRIAVDEATTRLEVGMGVESKRIADEILELRRAILDNMGKSRMILYTVIVLTSLTLVAAVAVLLRP